ncbi:MAG TPA: hypothetical protein VN859_00275, partial [Steroidobacteraceae bacterium]|nr:hypothetical protein [Steroidobacteraceae bacterium]
QLQRVDDVLYFSRPQKDALQKSMRAAGLATDQLNAIAFTGRGTPLLAVFDPSQRRLRAICRLAGRFGHEPRCEASLY